MRLLVAVSDATGVAYRSDGLILGDIHAQVEREGVLFGYAEADRITHAEMLRTDADVLVLASGPNEIHGNNWNTVVAPLIVEAEWSAVTSTAKERLAAKGVTMIPWLVASAGALLGAYFESRDEQVGGNLAKLLAKTGDWVQQVFQKVSECAASNDRPLDFAARQLAVERVADCLRLCR
jgi:glutamate dehydrogenase (NAD(P)+)